LIQSDPSAIRASTNAAASLGDVIVAIGIPYSVPWPPGAVTSVPAEKMSARSPTFPAAWAFLHP
jgi:hypothetical protein